MMRKKDLIARMGTGCSLCLVCDVVLAEIQKRGLSDLAFVLRRAADDLWTDTAVSDERKQIINNQMAALMQFLFCNPGERDSAINAIVLQLDREIPHESRLSATWLEVKELIDEVKAT
jgi:hypothetical protein